jgi:hypothetical protein
MDPAPERGKHTSWATFLKAHYVAHYHEERCHQGLQIRLLKCPTALESRWSSRAPGEI